jgi:hypothetical protein
MSDASDEIPQSLSEVSLALSHHLASYDLADLKLFLVKRNVRTVRNLLALNESDRGSVLIKARQYWESLGMLPNAVNVLFAVAVSGSSSSSSNAVPPSPAQTPPPRLLELPTAAPDDSDLVKDLPEKLNKVLHIVGPDRYNEVIRRLSRSAEQAVSSSLEATEALAALNVGKEEIDGHDNKELLKDVKRSIRNIVIWRCFGRSLSIESKALTQTFEHCCQHAHCVADTISQLTNGAKKIKEDLSLLAGMGQKGPGKTSASEASGKSNCKKASQPADEEFIKTSPVSIPSPCPITRPNQSQPEQRKVVVLLPGIQPKQTEQPAYVSIASSETGAGRTYVPSAHHHIVDQQSQSQSALQVLVPGTKQPKQLAHGSSAKPSATGTACTHTSPVHPGPTELRKHSSADAPTHPATSFEVVKLCVIAVVRQLHEVASSAESADLADWLGETLSTWTHRFESEEETAILISARGALLRTLQHNRAHYANSRLVLKALALTQGLRFLQLPFLEMALTVDKDDGGLDEQLLHAVAETWAWLLSELERKDAALKLELTLLSNEVEEDVGALETILELTFALPDYFATIVLKTEVARFCCQALVSLKLVINNKKDSIRLVKHCCNWIIEAVIYRYIEWPDVVHEGLTSLVAIIAERSEVFGIDVSQTTAAQAVFQETLTSHLNIKVVEDIARMCEAQTLFRDETVYLAFKLMVHTHPFIDILRVVFTSSKERSQRELLWKILDEIDAGLTPAIMRWAQVATSRGSSDVCSDVQSSANHPPQLPNILEHVKTAGGVGDDALSLLEEAVQKPYVPVMDGSQPTPSRPNLPFLFEWARSSWRGYHRDRFFLLGILFSPGLLICRLAPISSDQVCYANVARSLLDLNCLEEFDKPLQRALAETQVNLAMPQTPDSCIAWIETLRISLQVTKDLEDNDLAELAADQLIAAIDWAAGRQGWTGFIHQALRFLYRLQIAGYFNGQQTKKANHLYQLAVKVQSKLEDEVQAYMQATLFVSQLGASRK